MNVYFDTSSWNHLAQHAERKKLIDLIQQRKQIVLASVISLGEVLRTPDAPFRNKICLTMRTLHGDGPVLERSFNEFARAAAEGALQGRKDFLISQTGPGKYLRACMLDGTQPQPIDEILDWLQNMRDNMERFIQEIKTPQPDWTTCYVSLDVLAGEDFLELLCDLPVARELGASVPQMRTICGSSDIWKALGLTLAYIIELSTTHAPKNQGGSRRPGAQDMWQIPYLGVVEVFVTSDGPMLQSASKISALLPCPRWVVGTNDFFEHLMSDHTTGLP